jgi:hypothetical protein
MSDEDIGRQYLREQVAREMEPFYKVLREEKSAAAPASDEREAFKKVLIAWGHTLADTPSPTRDDRRREAWDAVLAAYDRAHPVAAGEMQAAVGEVVETRVGLGAAWLYSDTMPLPVGTKLYAAPVAQPPATGARWPDLKKPVTAKEFRALWETPPTAAEGVGVALAIECLEWHYGNPHPKDMTGLRQKQDAKACRELKTIVALAKGGAVKHRELILDALTHYLGDDYLQARLAFGDLTPEDIRLSFENKTNQAYLDAEEKRARELLDAIEWVRSQPEG